MNTRSFKMVLVFVVAAVLSQGIVCAAPSVTWNPGSVEYTVGTGYSGEVTVDCTCAETLTGVSFVVVPELQPFLSVEPTGFDTIYAGDSYQVKLRFSASAQALEGSYSGVVRMTAGRRTIAVPLPVQVNVITEESFPGLIAGRVTDAISHAALEGVVVDVYESANLAGSAASSADGGFTLSVPAGSGYTAVFSKAGYISVVYNGIEVQPSETTYLVTVLQIDEGHNGPGSISGIVTNALTGSGVSGLIIQLREGINSTEGAVVDSTTTGAGGTYAFAGLNAGVYTAEVSGIGYITAYFTVVCIGGQNTPNQNGSITPELQVGEVRIVLTWGASPSDLDSHLTGPLTDGSRFHLFFPYAESNGGSLWPDVSLDVDDVTSYGPETTTIRQQIPGVYRFLVHDYTYRNYTDSLALSNSGAQVRVYGEAGLMATFNVPANVGGTVWTVFEMNEGQISPVNTMSYNSDPSAVLAPVLSSTVSDNIDWSLLPSK